ncbi:MAG: hypothetical protein LBV26_05660, partial [Bacteroidales bacterium]|jgi:hypothetical protein|nr:hypothetical protein [Bacteroidales bacterium]
MATGFAACRKIHCSDFPVPLKEAYCPYTTGDLIKFTNHNNDTLALNVKSDFIDNTPPFRSNCKCACGAHASFETAKNSVYSLQITGGIDWFVGERAPNFCYLNCYFYGDESADAFRIIKENVVDDSEYTIFGDTVFIEKEDNERISSVKIIKNKGIVEFWDKKYECNWTRVE